MTSLIRLKTSLECFTRKEGRRWLAACPVLDVHTQGRTELEARRLIQEAVTLWFQSCIERNTLQQALQECGFTLDAGGPAPSRSRGMGKTSVLGSSFLVEIDIPAYQASAA